MLKNWEDQLTNIQINTNFMTIDADRLHNEARVKIDTEYESIEIFVDHGETLGDYLRDAADICYQYKNNEIQKLIYEMMNEYQNNNINGAMDLSNDIFQKLYELKRENEMSAAEAWEER